MKTGTGFVFLGCALLPLLAGAQRSFDTDILRETFGYDGDTPSAVSLDALQQGCPRRDCIPSIDAPRFVTAADAAHVADDDIVIAIDVNGDARAYPTRILDQHEIVNDTIGGEPIAVTWCPLCGSAVGVRRQVDGDVTQFGVSGLLYNSDLVFYDRKTATLWDQVEAKAIVGPLTGRRLELVPVHLVRWRQWRDAHPDTRVLSTDTGFAGRDYGRDHYARYRASDDLMFPVSARSKALRPKARVYGFEVDGAAIAFSADLLQRAGRHEHTFNGRDLLATVSADGSVLLSDRDSGERWSPVPLYWFAWYTFYPDTELVR